MNVASHRHRNSALAASLLPGVSSSGPPIPDPRADPSLQLAQQVDPDCCFGRWNIIANDPRFVECRYFASGVEYHQRANGRVDDQLYRRKKNFGAPITGHDPVNDAVADSENAKWYAPRLKPRCFDYLILEVNVENRRAPIGDSGKNPGWIFARDPDMSDESFQQLLGRLDAQGYDTSRLPRESKIPEQIGTRGFQ